MHIDTFAVAFGCETNSVNTLNKIRALYNAEWCSVERYRASIPTVNWSPPPTSSLRLSNVHSVEIIVHSVQKVER